MITRAILLSMVVVFPCYAQELPGSQNNPKTGIFPEAQSYGADSRESGLDGAGTGDDIFTESFESEIVEGECPVAPLASGLTAEQTAALIKTWDSIFTETIWPDPTFGTKLLSIPRSRYLAIEFNTGSFSGIDGGIKTVTSILTEGSRLGALSLCPGDFDDYLATASSACRKFWYVGGTLSWTTAPNPQFYECVLQPNTTYYLNLTFTDGITTASDTCVGNSCVTNLDVFHN